MVSTKIKQRFAPLTHAALPGDKAATMKAQKAFFQRRFLTRMKQRIKYFGKDNQSIFENRLRRNQIPRDLVSITPAVFSPAFNLPEFVLAPSEFEFEKNVSAPEEHYVGFLPDMQRVEKTDETLIAKLEHIQSIKRKKQTPVIYCSFGTVAHADKRLERFLHSLVEVIREENMICIMSLSDQTMIDSLAKADHLFVFPHVPQLEVLRFADVFITHGGLNSIKEAVYTQVPLLVYPLSTDVDHHGNSARVVHHALGLRGTLGSDSKQDIKRKINTLLNNPQYKQNLKSLYLADLNYSSDNFLRIFKNAFSLSQP
jgi:zeaxanthin glucosyltransferase